MKKLLALLLLSPLAAADMKWSYATNTLDLDRLSQWFLNDSYIGMTCSNDSSRMNTKPYDMNYIMMVFSIEERKGINLMWYTHKAYRDKSKDLTQNWTDSSKFAMHKNEEWSDFYINDFEITIKDPGKTYLSRETLILDGASAGGSFRSDTPCKIVTEEEMKEFGYKLEKLYQKHRKIVDDNVNDNLERRLNKRKL